PYLPVLKPLGGPTRSRSWRAPWSPWTRVRKKLSRHSRLLRPSAKRPGASGTKLGAVLNQQSSELVNNPERSKSFGVRSRAQRQRSTAHEVNSCPCCVDENSVRRNSKTCKGGS